MRQQRPVSGASPGRTATRRLTLRALALSGAIAAALDPAGAVTLGDVTLESTLGQPLNARVPVLLQPGETLTGSCVTAPVATSPELGTLPRPVVSVPETAAAGSYDLRITTTQPLYEPMYELQLQVRCPGIALVVRQYVLMLDLPGSRPATRQPAASAPVPAAMTLPAPAETPAPARPRPALAAPATPIDAGSSYRVQAGDTLSTIAARVGARGDGGLWAMADRIFAANPDAFIGGNPDLIKLGSEIVIPQPAASVPATTPDTVTATSTSVAVAAPAATLPAPDPSPAAAPDTTPAAASAQPAEAAPAPAPITADSPRAVFEDEQVREPSPATTEPAAREPAPARAAGNAAPRASGQAAPAWLAALIGILIGAAASFALLRERLTGALRGLWPRRSTAIAPVIMTPPAPAAPAPAPVRTQPAREPSMVVVEEHRAEDARSFAPECDPTDEQPAVVARATPDTDLSHLFEPPATGEFAVHADVSGLPAAADLDLDLSAATPDGPIDEEVGWIGDDTALGPTADMPRPGDPDGETVEHIDLQTLSQRAIDDEEVSRTLRDALELLESDYETNLTASQVIDQSKLNRILADDDDEDTMIRTGTDQFPRR